MEEKKIEEMKSELFDVIEKQAAGHTEMMPVVEFIDMFVDKLRKASSEALEMWPSGMPGPGEATMLAMARFCSLVMERMNKDGLMADGMDAYELFSRVIMPTAHRLVQLELDAIDTKEHDTACDMAMDVVNPDITIEEIVDKYFKDDITASQRRSIGKKIEKMRMGYLRRAGEAN